MDSTVFALLLGGALMHAVWNALVKGSADPLIAMTLVTTGSGTAAILLLPFIGWRVPHKQAERSSNGAHRRQWR